MNFFLFFVVYTKRTTPFNEGSLKYRQRKLEKILENIRISFLRVLKRIVPRWGRSTRTRPIPPKNGNLLYGNLSKLSRLFEIFVSISESKLSLRLSKYDPSLTSLILPYIPSICPSLISTMKSKVLCVYTSFDPPFRKDEYIM